MASSNPWCIYNHLICITCPRVYSPGVVPAYRSVRFPSFGFCWTRGVALMTTPKNPLISNFLPLFVTPPPLLHLFSSTPLLSLRFISKRILSHFFAIDTRFIAQKLCGLPLVMTVEERSEEGRSASSAFTVGVPAAVAEEILTAKLRGPCLPPPPSSSTSSFASSEPPQG